MAGSDTARDDASITVTFQGHPVLDWSAGGIVIAAAPERRRGEVVAGEFAARGAGLEVRLPVTVRLLDVRAGRATATFVDLAPDQGDVIGALATSAERPAAALLSRAWAPLPQGAPAAGKQTGWPFSVPRRAVMGATALAAILVAALATRFVLGPRDNALYAAIAVEATPVVARQTGYVETIDVKPASALSAGSPIVTLRLRSQPESRAVVDSQCACELQSVRVDVGDLVHEGDVIGYVARPDAPRIVEALFPAGARIEPGSTVSVLAAGGTKLSGRIAQAPPDGDGKTVLGLPDALRQDAKLVRAIVDIEGMEGVPQPGTPVSIKAVRP